MREPSVRHATMHLLGSNIEIQRWWAERKWILVDDENSENIEFN